MSRILFVAWRAGGEDAGCWGPVGRLERGDAGYRFVYTRGAQTLPGFRSFPEMPCLDEIYESEALFPLFANRLLPPSRPEFEAYLIWGGFDPNNPPDPIAILAVTGGRRATDSLELFPCPVPDLKGCYINKFFLHGIRHVPEAAQKRIAALTLDEGLIPMFDDFNPYDPEAVAVRTSGNQERMLIGYIPRYLAREVRELCTTCNPGSIELRVERVNQGAPLQQRLLCRMTACWPEGFSPCSHKDFQPIPTQLSSLVS